MKLLCTFTTVDKLPVCLGLIYQTYGAKTVAGLNCYSYVQSPSEVICVYNTNDSNSRLKNTILINRKKETNTLYSINALNGLIRQLNHGILDRSYLIDWYSFQNCLLLADGDTGYKTIKIQPLAQ